MLKRIIYIGTSGEKTVYYDRKKHLAIMSERHPLHSPDTTKKGNSVVTLLSVLIIFGSLLKFFPITDGFSGIYTKTTFVYLSILWLIEALFIIYIPHQVLYGNLNEVEKASRENFETAILSNKFWNSLGSFRKLTSFDIVKSATVPVILALTNPALIFILYKANQTGNLLGTPINSAIISFAIFGLIPGLTWIMWIENNPSRFLTIVKKYQRGTLNIKFADEIEREQNGN